MPSQIDAKHAAHGISGSQIAGLQISRPGAAMGKRLSSSFDPASRRRQRLAVAALTALAVAAGAMVTTTSTLAPGHAQTVVNQRVAVPAYFWPGTHWDRLLSPATATAVSLVVLNPESGPGRSRETGFVNVVGRARANGQSVVGYVDTAYGSRSVEVVTDEINRFYDWYGVDGIFFDQVSERCDRASYYGALAGHVNTKPGATLNVINPGMNTNECYASFTDVIVNFEGTPAMYAGWSAASWVRQYPSAKFWHIVYGAGPDFSGLVAKSKAEHAGLIYVTTDGMPNPFDTLPPDGLWSALLSAVVGAPSPPTIVVPATNPTTSTPAATTATSVVGDRAVNFGGGGPETVAPATATGPTVTGPTTTQPSMERVQAGSSPVAGVPQVASPAENGQSSVSRRVRAVEAPRSGPFTRRR